MSDGENLSGSEHLKSEIETFFAGKPYSDPLAYGGVDLVSVRVRDRHGVDPDTSQRLSASDRLWVNDESTPDNPINLVTSRTVFLGRGDGQEQYFINFEFDTGELEVTGSGKALFTGDPAEELLAGLRIIAKYETEPS